MRTTALPLLCESEPVFRLGVRNSRGDRPLGRVGGVVFVVGLRWARRKGEGESLANVSRAKESADGAVVSAIVCWTEMVPGLLGLVLSFRGRYARKLPRYEFHMNY